MQNLTIILYIYLSHLKGTTKIGGGCIESGNCADAISQVSCVSDRS